MEVTLSNLCQQYLEDEFAALGARLNHDDAEWVQVVSLHPLLILPQPGNDAERGPYIFNVVFLKTSDVGITISLTNL